MFIMLSLLITLLLFMLFWPAIFSVRKRAFVICAVFILGVAVTTPQALAAPDSQEADRIAEAIRVLDEIVNLPEEGVREALLENCYGIAILPGVVKAAYGFGGQFGKGVVLLKRDGVWTYPSFIKLIGGSVGWQIGVQKSDIVLVFKSLKSVEDITHGKITLGADVSVAAGPVGRHAEASTDLDLEAEIFSYAKTKGLFAGVSIKGASIRIDDAANESFYDDSGISAGDILIRDLVRAPRAAKELVRALEASIRF